MLDESIAARMQGLDVLVGVSGGKDSVVTLALACKYAKSVRGYFLYAFPDLDIQQKYLRYLSNRFGVEIVQAMHPLRSGWLNRGTYRRAPDPSVPMLSYREVYARLREQTGLDWIAVGEKQCDSLQRNGMLKKNGGFDEKRKWICPLATWTHRHVYSYLKLHSLPLSPEYQFAKQYGHVTSIGMLTVSEMKLMRNHFPNDFEKIKAEFPFIEALFIRERITARGKQVSGVRSDDDPSQQDHSSTIQP